MISIIDNLIRDGVCPYCGYKIPNFFRHEWIYGDHLRNCEKCGGECSDHRYHTYSETVPDIFTDYPQNSKENPFEPHSKGKYFLFQSGRYSHYFSYLSPDIEDFKCTNPNLLGAFQMGYSTLCIYERVFIVTSDDVSKIYGEMNNVTDRIYCVFKKDGTSMKVEEFELVNAASEKTREILDNIDECNDNALEAYKKFLKAMKDELGAEKIVLVGALEKMRHGWH